MKAFVHRVLLALSAGYILIYYSEFMFWAKFTGSGPIEWLVTYLLYCVATYVLLGVITTFQVRSVYAVFLAGAVYGWVIEGVIVQTMYEDFPLQISFTGLAWHSLISVLLGFYYVNYVLIQNNFKKTICTMVFIGVFYGFWSVCWWVEEGVITPVFEFFVYTIITTVPLVVAHWSFINLLPVSFTPTKIEWGTLLGILGFFFVVTVYIVPFAAIILPPLMGLVLVTLKRNNRIEHRKNIISALAGSVNRLHYVLILCIPMTATILYSFFLSFNVVIPTNQVVYAITTPLG
ncbi:MAG: hypothetical protein PVF58_04210, partial [Candidatus Methanofastidiosia archaeon]